MHNILQRHQVFMQFFYYLQWYQGTLFPCNLFGCIRTLDQSEFLIDVVHFFPLKYIKIDIFSMANLPCFPFLDTRVCRVPLNSLLSVAAVARLPPNSSTRIRCGPTKKSCKERDYTMS